MRSLVTYTKLGGDECPGHSSWAGCDERGGRHDGNDIDERELHFCWLNASSFLSDQACVGLGRMVGNSLSGLAMSRW